MKKWKDLDPLDREEIKFLYAFAIGPVILVSLILWEVFVG